MRAPAQAPALPPAGCCTHAPRTVAPGHSSASPDAPPAASARPRLLVQRPGHFWPDEGFLQQGAQVDEGTTRDQNGDMDIDLRRQRLVLRVFQRHHHAKANPSFVSGLCLMKRGGRTSSCFTVLSSRRRIFYHSDDPRPHPVGQCCSLHRVNQLGRRQVTRLLSIRMSTGLCATSGR